MDWLFGIWSVFFLAVTVLFWSSVLACIVWRLLTSKWRWTAADWKLLAILLGMCLVLSYFASCHH